MQTLELFCGTKSFSEVAKARGHKTLTLDLDSQFEPDICKDFLQFKISELPFYPDIVWASPPCECFSQCGISNHWVKLNSGEYLAASENAQIAREIFETLRDFILELNPTWYFIENPVSTLRKREFMFDYPIRRTVTYCQYGDFRMKPTDIWTNSTDWIPRPACKQGDLCHNPAPRGSKTGTQGFGSKIDRAIVPSSLCEEIIISCENSYSKKTIYNRVENEIQNRNGRSPME